MKKRTWPILTLIISDIFLLGITTYYYLLERWATGTIYLFIIVTSAFFTFVGVIERRGERVGKYTGNEVEIAFLDLQRGGKSYEGAKESLKKFTSDSTEYGRTRID